MKVMTLVGTRPEIIRLSAVIRSLEEASEIEHVLVHTGQNWDRELNGVFFEDLRLPRPSYNLEVDVSSLGATMGDILRKTEKVIQVERPDAFLVLGDTNSSLGLIMAKRMHVPTYHMEAGNRCFDANVPEEINRRIVDHTADFNLAYTEHARRNLLAEGLHPRRVMVTGSPMNEVLGLYRNSIDQSEVVSKLGLTAGEFFVVSAHREENVDPPKRLELLVDSINTVANAWGWPVLVSTHPRTRKRLEEAEGLRGGGLLPHPLVQFHAPFGFLDYNRLQMTSACVLSDSGTVSEEAAMLGFRAITLRSSIERPEALDTGSITLTDLEPTMVMAGVRFAMSRGSSTQLPTDYAVTNTSDRVINFILSTASQHRFWSGLR